MGKIKHFLQEVQMKQIFSVLNILVFSAILIALTSTGVMNTQAGTAPAPALNQVGESCQTGRTISVSGTAVVNVAPDRALVQLGVQSNGVSPSEVEGVNALAIQRVIKAIESLGVDAKDIVTDRYIVEPVYDSYESLYIKGYRIHNLVAVTLRDVDKLSALVVAALEAGANQVVNVELYTSELRQYRDQARELAMQAAAEKARDLADAAGAKAGCILTINENTWSSYNGWWSGSNRDLWTQNVVQNVPQNSGAFTPSTDGPVDLGQISVRAEVSASFALE